METNYKNKKRAFVIFTKNNAYSNDKYVVIADTFGAAEEIYWSELGGYHEILRIEAIPDTLNVGYKID